MLADRAVPIEIDGGHGDLAPFSILDERCAAARVAYLVEMDHFVAEKSAFRLLCLRYLASQGWRWVGEEVDWRVGERLDGYLTTGDETLLAPLVEEPWYCTGILAEASARHDDGTMQADRAELVRAVKEAVPAARWFGFDVGAGDPDYLEAANLARTYAELDPVMALREQKIHARVARWMADHPEEKLVLMAGSTHLLKDDDTASAPGVLGPGGSTVHSIGHHVAHELTDAPVVSIWLVHGGGTTANPYLAPPGTLVSHPGTVNAELLERVGRPCVVPVSDDRERRTVTQMHNAVLECRFADQVDALVFLPEVTPLRPA